VVVRVKNRGGAVPGNQNAGAAVASGAGTAYPGAPSTGVVWPNDGNTGFRGSLTTYTGPLTITTDGTTISGQDIVLGDGQGFQVNANNVTIRDCRIRYTGTSTVASAHIGYGAFGSYQHGLLLDHVTYDGHHRAEYGLRAFGDFHMTFCNFQSASHVIDAFGDPVTHVQSEIDHSFIWNSDDKPYQAVNPGEGHSAAVYFSGANSNISIHDNTLICPKWARGMVYTQPGWVRDFAADNTDHTDINNATGCIAFFPTEGTISASDTYNVSILNNRLSGGGYVLVGDPRDAGGNLPATPHFHQVTFSGNDLTADSDYAVVSGWATDTGAGFYNFWDAMRSVVVSTGNTLDANATNPNGNSLNLA